MKTEIGGYLELERFGGSLLHERAFALESGRACLAWLIEQKKIRRIALPDFLCDVVAEVCRAEGTEIRKYAIGEDLMPQDVHHEPGESFYLVNFYGQLAPEDITGYRTKADHLIVDNAQAYFTPPVPGIDTLYTCRKFLGVPDGGFLYTDLLPKAYVESNLSLPSSEEESFSSGSFPGQPERGASLERMRFVLGRFEQSAGAFFDEASHNNDSLPLKPRRMSVLTENLLRAVDYTRVQEQRTENFLRLHEALGGINHLPLRVPEGPYAYPLMLEDGPACRQALIAQKIFVPQLWPNVVKEQPAGSTARKLAENILPLPCDQRYGKEEMEYIIACVRAWLKEKGRREA